jgi:transposase InsO family protein
MLRKEFISFVENGEQNFSEICRRYKISRKTGYKWLEKYKNHGLAGLADSSKAPLTTPAKTKEEMEEAVISVRAEHGKWGGRKIRQYLLNNGYNHVPARSTITDILHRHNLIIHGDNQRTKAWIRFVHDNPNDLWQMDFKGHFEMANKERCHPLTIIDDHSRFSLAITACKNEQGKTVEAAMIEVFSKYGLPKAINVDNGNPWGSKFDICRYTSFGLWLIDQGIILSHSRPHHPQTNGKNERFNRTLKAEIISNSYISCIEEAQKIFDKWRHIYNFDRPHEALDYRAPGDIYEPSYRQYRDKMEEYEYSPDYLCKKVDVRGRFHIEVSTLSRTNRVE